MARAGWKSKYTFAALAVVLVLTGALVISQAGSGDTAKGVTTARGDTTTKAAVVGALESTGYEFRYRKVPRVEGYENISGEAIHGDDRIQFTVEIRLAGPYEEMKERSEMNPQPPVLRYGRGSSGGNVVGNAAFDTAQQTPAYAGRGPELETTKVQTKMEINVNVALSELFAPQFQPVG